MRSKLEIQVTAEALVDAGKGILAADESFGSIQRRFEPYSIISTPENRRSYRELFISTPDVGRYISGVILFDETIRQSGADGTSFPEMLERQGILPGVKVDKGTHPLPLFPGERMTEGLDGLRERLVEYRTLGARFAKWRAIYSISPSTPTAHAINVNARDLARFAALCQENGLTPIVEPEVLMDGMHHISVCEDATCAVLAKLFEELQAARVMLEGLLLKPNMITAGADFPKQFSVEEVAESTVRALRRTVPAAVPGIVFLSGGQGPEIATAHLNAMNALGPFPWKLSFSYGRALQAPSLNAWRGKDENWLEAQRLFLQRARLNSLAAQGQYTRDLEMQTL